jgi:phosphohistidine swiveling domain-containing protein
MTTPGRQAATTFEQMVGSLDDELCTWPAQPQVFTRANALDQWPDPITPLTQDLVELPQERGLEGAFVRVLGVTEPSPEWTWNGCFYGYVMFGVTPSAALADNLPGWNRAGVYADYLGVHPDPDAAQQDGGSANPLSLLKIGANFAAALRNYPRQALAATAAARRQLDDDLTRDWPSQSDDYLCARIEMFVHAHPGQREPHAVASVISAALFKQFTRTTDKLAGPHDGARLATEVITGLGGVHMSEAIEAMARVKVGQLDRRRFLRDYGFRGSNEFELASSPWADDAATVDRLIDAADAPAATAAEAQRRARQELKRLAGWRWPLLRRQLSFTENHLRWRENGKVPMAMAVASLRLVVREAGRRLAGRGAVDEPSDVFYLRKAELNNALRGQFDREHLRERIARRRETRQLAFELPLPEIVDATPHGLVRVSDARWRSLGVFPPETPDERSTVLAGVGGSPGTATGRARIVHDPNTIDIDDGDILVARGTDSAWTPLFMQASAVVVDIGGVMSHACIAAREVGIPCVIDVKQGTTRICEGQRICVDGTAGSVTLM